MSIAKETTVDWMSRFWATGEPDLAQAGHKTISEGASHEIPRVLPSSREGLVAPSVQSDAQINEEIKRRQISLAVRYVMIVRVR